MPTRVLRPDEVAGLIGVDRSTLWRWERNGSFPARRQFGPNVVGWPAAEIDTWIESRPSAGIAATTAPEN